MGRKLDGQADVLEQMPDAVGATSEIRRYRDELATTDTLTGLRVCEGQAARIYWEAWAPTPVRFTRKMHDRVPDHWKVFGTRSSPLTGSPRTAANPPNAILNYLYAIAEAECRIALLAVGLDPGLGIVHADQKNRDSFVFDVIEPLRPVVDRQLLTLLGERSFAKAEFFETRQGACRLMPPLPQALAELAPEMARLAAPMVEHAAKRLTGGQDMRTQPLTVPTLLTESNRSAGRDGVRVKPKHEAVRRSVSEALSVGAARWLPRGRSGQGADS